MKTFVRILTVVCFGLAAHGTAHAQTLITKTWIPSSGAWSGAANWNPSGVPTGATSGTSNPVVIDNGGTVTLTTSNFFHTLSIGSTSQVLATSAAALRASSTSAGDQITNAGLISTSAGTLNFRNQTNTAALRINNSGGMIRSTGGLLSFNGDASIAPITGGTIQVQAGGGFFLYKDLSLAAVAFDNSGTSSLRTTTNQAATSFDVNSASSFANSGTLSIFNSSNVTSAPVRYTRFQVASTGTFTNASTGVIDITRDQATTLNVLNHEAYFTLNSTGFNNQGAINITSFASQVGNAYFSSSQDFSNAGAIKIDGPRSSIRMASNTFTQTAGSLSLINGGTMVASSVLINSGTLLGTGTINAPVTIGGILAPGNAGIGTLNVTNNVTWNADNAWLFTLGAPAASLAAATTSSDADLLSLTGTFTKGTGSTFTFDFANSGTDGWYKLVDFAATNFNTGTSTQFAATNLSAGKTANFVVDSSSTALYVQIVPEPSTLALAVLGIGLGGYAVSRRRRG